MTNILQANFNRSKTANDLLQPIIYKRGVDLLLLSEQYQNRKSSTWFAYSLGTVAIWTPHLCRIPMEKHGLDRGFVWIKSGGVTYFSCYLTLNESLEDFQKKFEGTRDP